MSSISYYLASMVKKLWMLVAFVLVFLAVLLSVVRLSLPYMDGHKHRLENWIQEQYGAQLTVGHISAVWKGVGPAMVLRNISIRTGENSPVKLVVDETQVEIDFWASVLARKIKSRKFHLSGLELTLDTQVFSADSETEMPIVDALQSLFLEQLRRFSVNDSRLVLNSARRQQVLNIQGLQWQNQDGRHRGAGQLQVQELANNSASFVLDLFGTKDELQGTFYADARELDVSPWAEQVLETQLPLKESRINFQLWANINQSRLTSVQSKILNSQFSWNGEEMLTSEIENGEFTARPVKDEWHFSLENLQLQLNQNPAQIIELTGRMYPDHSIDVRMADFEVEPLLPLVKLLGGESTDAVLKEVQPNARIEGLGLRVEQGSVMATVRIADIETHQWGEMPGINQLAMDINWHDKQGHIQLEGKNGEFRTHNLLGHRVAFSALNAEVYIDVNDGFSLLVPSMEIDSEFVTLQQAISYEHEKGHLAIATNIQPLSIANARQLFPLELMGKETYAYLNEALVAGQVTEANLLWNGAVSDFPYGQNQGIFQAGVELENATFLFDSEWPQLEELQLALLFENEALYMASERGRLMSVQVEEMSAVIPELAEDAILNIKARTRAEAQDVTELMQVSQLADSVGAALGEIHIEGELAAGLELNIPLSGTDVVARGKVQFNDNQVMINTLSLPLAQVNGSLQFVNDKITAQGLKAQLWQQELQLSLDGKDQKQGYQADIKLAGHWQVPLLLKDRLPTLQPYLNGIVNWRGNLALTLPEEGFSYDFRLNSDLPQLSSSLPVPLAKDRGEKMRLLLNSEGNEFASTVRVLLGNDLKFNGILPHQEMRFSRAHLSVGDNDFVGMGAGFSIAASLPLADFSPWYQTIDDLISGLPETDDGILSAPQRIYLQVEKLNIADQILEDVEVTAKPVDNYWALMVNARQARAEVKLYQDWLQQGMEVNANYLKLSMKDQPQETGESAVDLNRMPPLKLTCAQCSIDEYQLGKVDLVLSRAQGGMEIDKLQVTRGKHTLTTTGNWYITEQGSSTRLKGALNSDDFGGLLKDFQVDAGIRDSDASMTFDLSWQKAPYDFNYASLNGELDWKLGDGYITELSDGGARLLSLLSLESLIRKLKLDFRDVFAKGFFYDEMIGTFDIKNGYVETDNTRVDGAAAEISLSGYTNLNDKKLNYQVKVSPKVTSSLPVILAWMVNPATAIAAFALDEVLTSAKVISNIEYSLSGSIDKPILTEKGRKSRDVQLPAKARPKPEPSVETQFQEKVNG